MNTQVSVDADLLAQAMQKMRIQDSQLLIEQFLRSIVQSQDKKIEALDIHSAFGLVKTTRTATLEQIEQAIAEGEIDDNA
jgi:Arc/MetJ family transcription regulator